VFALGLVLLMMRRIGQPRAQRNLQSWLGLETTIEQRAVSGERKAENRTFQALPAPDHPGAALSAEPQPPLEPKPSPDLLNDTTRLDQQLREIQDNTSFRPEEQAAWFTLLARLEQSTPSTLQQQSMGPLSYAQLLGQPDVYRGRVVTLHGTALREERLHAPANAVGIHAYHRLILRPAGGGEWPFVVYALKLPANFPRGDPMRARIEVTGYFFKNWSYSWGDGLGLAPVVLANNVRWIPRAPPDNTQASGDRLLSTDWKLLVLAIVAAALFAWMGLALALRQTGRQRPRVAQGGAYDAQQQIHDTLRQLSERESRE
jgi:hypothetical protein